jgi:hypothetical protein
VEAAEARVQPLHRALEARAGARQEGPRVDIYLSPEELEVAQRAEVLRPLRQEERPVPAARRIPFRLLDRYSPAEMEVLEAASKAEAAGPVSGAAEAAVLKIRVYSSEQQEAAVEWVGVYRLQIARKVIASP